jgi:hypothetical protein
MWKLLWLAAGMYFGHDNLEPTDRLVPPGWKGNAWGPEATQARATGAIPPIQMTPSMKQWEAWGKAALRDGDILFRRGNAKLLRGHFPMSRFIANLSGSVFSHTGIAAVENGEVVVYDTTSLGVRRQPFYVWVLDNVGPLGVKRVRPEYAAYAVKATEFCRKKFFEKPPFDYDLGLDDAALYCVEMTEKAYRNNGLPLSAPVRMGDLENIDKFPICVLCFLRFTDVTLDTQAYFPGNERHGIWSSAYLTTVYAPPGGVTVKLRKGFGSFGGNPEPSAPRTDAQSQGRSSPAPTGRPTESGAAGTAVSTERR